MKKLGPYVLTAIVALVLGVLLTMQCYAASEAVAKIEEEEVVDEDVDLFESKYQEN